jgi:hypothetical protein
MTSWPDYLPSGHQKRFWRDPVKRIGAMTRATFTAQPRLVLASMSFAIELLWSGHNL